MKKISTLLMLLYAIIISAQMGIGTATPHASAALEIKSTTKGLLYPRMTMEQMLSIQSPTEGLAVYCTDCSPKSLYVYDGSLFKSTTNQSITINVGDYKFGGIVFWVDPANPNHGLVVALDDASTTAAKWGCGSFVPTTHLIGGGKQNTLNMLATNCAGSIAPLVDAYSAGGYSDWFLPNMAESQELFNNRDQINTAILANNGTTILDKQYWTSSQKDSNSSYRVTFSVGGGITTSVKTLPLPARPIRSF